MADGLPPEMQTELNRRDVLKLGGAGLAAVFGTRALDFLGDDDAAAATCLLTPESTDGPYWVEHSLTRRDVRAGKPGLPLVLRFTILNARTCRPIDEADVEIWHCDALGNYSAVDGARSRYLRGHQRSNARGKAEFLTIFPGWYPGRTPHIHMKVKRSGKELLTTQCYVKGHPGNAKDGIFRRVKDQRILDAISVDYKPVPNSKIGELAGKFDVVLGVTPEA